MRMASMAFWQTKWLEIHTGPLYKASGPYVNLLVPAPPHPTPPPILRNEPPFCCTSLMLVHFIKKITKTGPNVSFVQCNDTVYFFFVSGSWENAPDDLPPWVYVLDEGCPRTSRGHCSKVHPLQLDGRVQALVPQPGDHLPHRDCT